MPDPRPFQVDLKSVVDLLGRHIYSSPRVYLRELMQNGIDAISARKEFMAAEWQASGHIPNGQHSPDPTWGIRITPYTGPDQEFVLTDDGIGLTLDEVGDLLATVGRTSKRDIFDMRRTDYLGQFGIGLLSCFMVADEIRILTRSARGGQGAQWIGSGEGTFTVTPADGLPIGTSVHLRPRFDTEDLLSADTVERLAGLYGEFLPAPIEVRRNSSWHRVTRDPPFLHAASVSLDDPINFGATDLAQADIVPGPAGDAGDLADYALATFGSTPMATFPLSAPGSLTSGVAFVLPYAPPPTARPSARVYLGRMLLNERTENLLPDWAFFIRAVVNSDGLSPTASRESLVEDAAMDYTREQFSNSIRTWLIDLAIHHPIHLGAFLHVHEPAIKQLILHDEEMAGIFIGWLSLETSAGQIRVDDLVRRSPRVRYARTLDEFRQIAPITPRDMILVNGGYVHDSELCELLPTVYPAVTVERADVLSELDRLDTPTLADRTATVALEDRASAVLESRGCRAVVRVLDADNVPALYVADPETLRHIDRKRASSATEPGLWSDIMAQVDAFALRFSGEDEADGFTSRLCLNWSDPLIRSLATITDGVVFDRCVRLLYVQSQLAGHHRLSGEDRTLMSTALTDLIALSTAHSALGNR